MLRSLNRSAALRVVALLAVGGVFSACSLNTDVSGPAGLFKSSGDSQTAPVNTQLPSPFVVLVVDQFGAPLENAAVNWTITSGGGSLSATQTATNEGGTASTIYTTGPSPGPATITAQVHGLFAVTFSVAIT